MASSHTVIDAKTQNRVYQQILSSGYNGVTQAQEQLPVDDQPQVGSMTMPIFENLNQMKVDELKDICKKYNIKQGKNKVITIKNITARSTTLNRDIGELNLLKKSLVTMHLSDPAPLHDFYRSWFNLVDLVDRKWYAVEEHYPNQNWKSKHILAILRCAILNMWTYAIRVNFQKWKQWRKAMALKLIEYDTE